MELGFFEEEEETAAPFLSVRRGRASSGHSKKAAIANQEESNHKEPSLLATSPWACNSRTVRKSMLAF